jgi:hypothetical protein
MYFNQFMPWICNFDRMRLFLVNHMFTYFSHPWARGNQQLSLWPDASNDPMPKKRPPLGSARGPENVVQNPPLVNSACTLLALTFPFTGCLKSSELWIQLSTSSLHSRCELEHIQEHCFQPQYCKPQLSLYHNTFVLFSFTNDSHFSFIIHNQYYSLQWVILTAKISSKTRWMTQWT